MKVEVWSDVVCPWCYVGKRHLEEALGRFRHGDQVSVEWRSFELNPASPPRVGLTMSQILQRKYGMSEDQAEEGNRRMTALAAGVGLEYTSTGSRPAIPSTPIDSSIWPPPTGWGTP